MNKFHTNVNLLWWLYVLGICSHISLIIFNNTQHSCKETHFKSIPIYWHIDKIWQHLEKLLKFCWKNFVWLFFYIKHFPSLLNFKNILPQEELLSRYCTRLIKLKLTVDLKGSLRGSPSSSDNVFWRRNAME